MLGNYTLYHLQKLQCNLCAAACLLLICSQAAVARSWGPHLEVEEAPKQHSRPQNIQEEVETSAAVADDIFKASEQHLPLVVIFKRHLIQHAWLRQLCNASSVGVRHDNASSNRGSGVPPNCAILVGVCRHLYKASFTGLSGFFSRQQYLSLQHCIGKEAIDFVERDGKVLKAEHPDHQGWWRHKPPLDLAAHLPQLIPQQQQPSSHRSARATKGSHISMIKSFDSSTRNTSSSGIAASMPTVYLEVNDTLLGASDHHGQSNKGSPSNHLWRWTLAELGLAAQQQLSLNQPAVASVPGQVLASSVSVADFHSPTAGITATGAAELVLDAQTVLGRQKTAASKNQDPGLPVNYDAFQYPGIVAASALDATASRLSVPPAQHIQTAHLLQPKEAEEANKSPGFKVQKLMTALWNLDRLDQRVLPLDQRFVYGSPQSPGTGKGVTIYILDSGIRAAHQEFQAWSSHDTSGPGASRAVPGPDYIDNDGVADDCDGHGTHVASTAAGRSVGVAKEANVVAVRVLDCDGAGSISDVIAALDWVAANAKRPAVASLSLGVPAGQWSRALEDAVKGLVASGVPVVVAAGNDAQDSCQVAPARVPEVITVGASNLPGKFSNEGQGGACLDIFAPGVDILGACGGPSRCERVTDKAYTWATGTSMAAPHVTGWVAVYLEAHPQATPAEVQSALVAAASSGSLQSQAMLEGTPNHLLFTAVSGQ